MLLKQIKYSLIITVFSLAITACQDHKEHLTGYIEGEYTYLSSDISGTLEKLPVERGQEVKQGTLLYQLELDPEAGKLLAATSRVNELKIQLVLATLQLQRQIKLLQTHATSQEKYDFAQTTFFVRQHQLNQAKAQLSQIQWAYDQKTKIAPASGFVFNTYFRLGENVPANRPVLSILTPDNIKVLFYVPEPLLSKIKLRQTIYFNCDGCKKTTATISYISPEAEYTPPVIYSKDSRQKLVYLIRADIPLNIAQNFHPGQPVDIILDEK